MASTECMITGKGTVRGNNVAHCNLKKRRSFRANVRWKRVWSNTENRFVRLLLSTKGLRTLDKKGVEFVLALVRAKGYQV